MRFIPWGKMEGRFQLTSGGRGTPFSKEEDNILLAYLSSGEYDLGGNMVYQDIAREVQVLWSWFAQKPCAEFS